MQGTPFSITVPLLKAVANQDTGSIEHCGVISDQSLDLQGDALETRMLEKSYAFLRRQGKFTWDHGADEPGRPAADIGDVFQVRTVTPEEVQELFGVKIEKSGTAILGNVYPLVDPVLADPVLRKAHHRMRAGARLWYSVDGQAVRGSDGIVRAAFVPRVSITPQSINQNSVCCRVVKSLSAATDLLVQSDDELPETLPDFTARPDLVVSCDAPYRGMETDKVVLSKGLFGELMRQWLRGVGKGSREAPARGKLARVLKEHAGRVAQR